MISASASVDANTGTPGVSVVKTGTGAAPNFAFNFVNLKGETGAAGQNGADGRGMITSYITDVSIAKVAELISSLPNDSLIFLELPEETTSLYAKIDGTTNSIIQLNTSHTSNSLSCISGSSASLYTDCENAICDRDMALKIYNHRISGYVKIPSVGPRLYNSSNIVDYYSGNSKWNFNEKKVFESVYSDGSLIGIRMRLSLPNSVVVNSSGSLEMKPIAFYTDDTRQTTMSSFQKVYNTFYNGIYISQPVGG